MLATNITQAQAFCIATACLQVPVFVTRASPFSTILSSAANSLHERQSSNKLNLFRPSLLFSGGLNRQQSKWSNKLYSDQFKHHHHHEQYSSFRLPFEHRQLKHPVQYKMLNRRMLDDSKTDGKSNWLKDLLRQKGINYYRMTVNAPLDQDGFYVSEYNSDKLANKTNVLQQTITELTTTPVNNPNVDLTTEKVDIITPPSPPPPPLTTTSTTRKAVTSPVNPQISPPTIHKSLSDNKTLSSYPNFNRLHALIFSHQYHRPSLAPLPLIYPFKWKAHHESLDRSNNFLQQIQFNWAAGQVANLMRTVSNNLTKKKLNLLNTWQNMSHLNTHTAPSKLPSKI